MPRNSGPAWPYSRARCGGSARLVAGGSCWRRCLLGGVGCGERSGAQAPDETGAAGGLDGGAGMGGGGGGAPSGDAAAGHSAGSAGGGRGRGRGGGGGADGGGARDGRVAGGGSAKDHPGPVNEVSFLVPNALPSTMTSRALVVGDMDGDGRGETHASYDGARSWRRAAPHTRARRRARARPSRRRRAGRAPWARRGKRRPGASRGPAGPHAASRSRRPCR
jgi:hypothetical protein